MPLKAGTRQGSPTAPLQLAPDRKGKGMGEDRIIHDAIGKINFSFNKIERASAHSLEILDRMQTHLDIAFWLILILLALIGVVLALAYFCARSSVGLEQPISNRQVAGSNPAERTNSPDPER